MKTIIRKYSSRMLLAFAGTFSLGMVSCDDMLDMKPQGQLLQTSSTIPLSKG